MGIFLFFLIILSPSRLKGIKIKVLYDPILQPQRRP